MSFVSFGFCWNFLVLNLRGCPQEQAEYMVGLLAASIPNGIAGVTVKTVKAGCGRLGDFVDVFVS